MNTHQVARIAQLLGEPARAAMLMALMDGRALTARELAQAGGVGAPTASRHLAQLVEAGLLSQAQQGRHRYHRLASRDVARALESLMQLAAGRGTSPRPALRTGPKDAALRFARTCYDHLAGQLGVAITERLVADGAIILDADAGQWTDRLGDSLAGLGLSLDEAATAHTAPRSSRPACRPCLDWSERRPHVAGRLGALICSHCQQRGWLRRRPDSRALELTPPGALALRRWLGARHWPEAGPGD